MKNKRKPRRLYIACGEVQWESLAQAVQVLGEHGAASSGCCATFTNKKAAERYAKFHGARIQAANLKGGAK